MAEQINLDINITAVKQELKALQDELQRTGSSGVGAFKDMVKEAQTMATAQRTVNTEIKGAATAIGQVGQGATGFSGALKKPIADISIFGKSIGDWTTQLGTFIGKFSGGEVAAGKFGGAFSALSSIIKLSPIGLVTTAVALLVDYFSKSQPVMDKVSQIMSYVSAAAGVLTERLLKLGDAVIHFLSGDFSGAAKDIKEAVTGIVDEMQGAADAAAELAKRMQKLRDDTLDVSVETARMNVELQKARSIADDTTKSFAERLVAAKRASDLEKQIAEQAKELANERFFIAEQEIKGIKDASEIKAKDAKAQIDLRQAEQEYNNAIFASEQRLRALREQAAAENAKHAEDAQKERDKLQTDLEKLRALITPPSEEQKAFAGIEKQYTDAAATIEAGLAKLSEIEKKRGKLNDTELAQRKEFLDLKDKLNLKELSDLVDAFDKISDTEQRAREANEARIKALHDKDLAAAKKAIDEESALNESGIAITEQNFKNYIKVLEANGVDKEEIQRQQQEFDKIIAAKRIQLQIDTDTKLLDLIDASDTTAIDTLKNKIEKLKAELAGLSIDPAPKGKKDKSLGELLGLSGDDLKGFDKAVEQVKKGLEGIIQARVDAAKATVAARDQEVKASEDKVKQAQDDLNTELAIAKLGFASHVTDAKNRLELAKNEEAEAKARQERAIENSKKAQRAQILIDTALQANNIITASTDVYKGFAAIPIIGVALGIAAVTLLIGSFLTSKALALQSVKAAKGIQGNIKGDGIVVGPSHEGDGVPLEVEGGEFIYQDGKRVSVVNKRATDAHFALLKAINEDNRPAMYDYLQDLTNGVQRSSDIGAPPGASTNTDITSKSLIEQKTHALLEENNRLQREIIRINDEREIVYDLGSELLIKRKGREERIKKR